MYESEGENIDKYLFPVTIWSSYGLYSRPSYIYISRLLRIFMYLPMQHRKLSISVNILIIAAFPFY